MQRIFADAIEKLFEVRQAWLFDSVTKISY